MSSPVLQFVPHNDLQFEITSIGLKRLGCYIDHVLKSLIVKEDGQVNDLCPHSLDGHLTPTLIFQHSSSFHVLLIFGVCMFSLLHLFAKIWPEGQLSEVLPAT